MHENIEEAKNVKTRLNIQLLERQQQLKWLSDQRIAALNLSDPVKEKQHTDLLTTILLHDDKHVSSIMSC